MVQEFHDLYFAVDLLEVRIIQLSFVNDLNGDLGKRRKKTHSDFSENYCARKMHCARLSHERWTEQNRVAFFDRSLSPRTKTASPHLAFCDAVLC